MAQVKVSDLTQITTLQDTDLVLITQDVGGGNYDSKYIDIADMKADFAASGSYWSLSGNASTGPSDYIGTSDNLSLRIRTNNTDRIYISSNGNVGIGTSSMLTGFHVNKSTPYFQTTSIQTGISITDSLSIDFGSSTTGSMGFRGANDGYFSLIHRTPTNNFGATIELGNDSALLSARDGKMAFKTGTATNNNTSYRLHLESDGKMILVNGLPTSYDSSDSQWPKLGVKSTGNTAATIAFCVRNSDDIELIKVWDHQRIVTNRPDTYSPVAALDFYTTLTSTSNFMYMESGSGEIWEQKCNGNIVIGRDITAGSKLGIKGNTNAFPATPAAALHVKGDVRIDDQLSATAGATSGQYLIINCNGTNYKIELLNV